MSGKVSKDARARTRADTDPEKGAKKPRRTPLEKAKRQIIERMMALGTYRVQYMAAINRTAELYVELERLAKRYEAEGFEAITEHTNKAGATNLMKSPTRSAIEDTYSLLLAHERELGLTPMGMKKLGTGAEEPNKKSPLELALEKLSGG